LFGHYWAYFSGGFNISTLAMDGKSAAIKTPDMINGPWLQASASGMHYVIVDARIRKIIKGTRSKLSGLTFKIF
jgi:hypothetical protein